jgi:hypothetical protein
MLHGDPIPFRLNGTEQELAGGIGRDAIAVAATRRIQHNI